MKYSYKPFNSVIIPTNTTEKIELEAAIKTIEKLVSKVNDWSRGTNNAYEYCSSCGTPLYIAQTTMTTVIDLLKYWTQIGVKFNNDYNVEQAIVNEFFDINEMFGCELNDRIVEKAIENRKVNLDLEYLSEFNKRLNTLNSVTIETHEEFMMMMNGGDFIMKVFANELYATSTEEKKALDTVLSLYDRVVSISETGTILNCDKNGEGKTYKTDDLLTINFKELYKLLKEGFESYHECEF